ncbi:hypothetical protein ANN_14432 [Periplaneta americana]|uniref:Uncharacterized protein n=1 Tax=Periplaneta americana TaxID=6978 RepID=A0ABQ8SXS6_PERAM|nr:hypothetical protein ANN_14432 [Periplaneta americana]
MAARRLKPLPTTKTVYYTLHNKYVRLDSSVRELFALYFTLSRQTPVVKGGAKHCFRFSIVNRKSQKLQRVHNSCVRFVCDVRRDDHITPSFQTLNWGSPGKQRGFGTKRAKHQLLVYTDDVNTLGKNPQMIRHLSASNEIFSRYQYFDLEAIDYRTSISDVLKYTIDYVKLFLYRGTNCSWMA